jgi:hypothetical protein
MCLSKIELLIQIRYYNSLKPDIFYSFKRLIFKYFSLKPIYSIYLERLIIKRNENYRQKKGKNYTPGFNLLR